MRIVEVERAVNQAFRQWLVQQHRLEADAVHVLRQVARGFGEHGALSTAGLPLNGRGGSLEAGGGWLETSGAKRESPAGVI